jgi:hypothetical protein
MIKRFCSTLNRRPSEEFDYRTPHVYRFEEIRLRMIEGKSLPWFDLYASAALEAEPLHGPGA